VVVPAQALVLRERVPRDAEEAGAAASNATSSSIAWFTAAPIAPDEPSTWERAGETRSRKSTAPSAATSGSRFATFLISATASRTRERPCVDRSLRRARRGELDVIRGSRELRAVSLGRHGAASLTPNVYLRPVGLVGGAGQGACWNANDMTSPATDLGQRGRAPNRCSRARAGFRSRRCVVWDPTPAEGDENRYFLQVLRRPDDSSRCFARNAFLTKRPS
jgi:hypothetical protein